MPTATLGLAAATFLASAVDFVEAFTIVLAMGLSRSWRAALTGTAVALLALTAVTAVAGLAPIPMVAQAAIPLGEGPPPLLFCPPCVGQTIPSPGRPADLPAQHSTV